MESSAASGIGFFGVWQVIYIVLALAIDAPWNKVQNWQWFNWLDQNTVLFPTVMGIVTALVIVCVGVVIAGVWATFTGK